jgi:hypothetical protein
MWRLYVKNRRKVLEYMCYQGIPMKTIRASEISSYLFCARAWWYQKQGVESATQAEMTAGTELHRQHGRTVIASNLTRTLAVIFLLVALALLVAYCTYKFI